MHFLNWPITTWLRRFITGLYLPQNFRLPTLFHVCRSQLQWGREIHYFSLLSWIVLQTWLSGAVLFYLKVLIFTTHIETLTQETHSWSTSTGKTCWNVRLSESCRTSEVYTSDWAVSFAAFFLIARVVCKEAFQHQFSSFLYPCMSLGVSETSATTVTSEL